SQNMLEIALELASHDPAFEAMALKFVEHFFWIAVAINRPAADHDSLWDEEDGFFYDLLRLPNGKAVRLKVRSMVGLLPLCATTVLSPEIVSRFPTFIERVLRRFKQVPELLWLVPNMGRVGIGGTHCMSLVDETRLRRILQKMLDENEF